MMSAPFNLSRFSLPHRTGSVHPYFCHSPRFRRGFPLLLAIFFLFFAGMAPIWGITHVTVRSSTVLDTAERSVSAATGENGAKTPWTAVTKDGAEPASRDQSPDTPTPNDDNPTEQTPSADTIQADTVSAVTTGESASPAPGTDVISGRILANYHFEDGDGLTAVQKRDGSITLLHPHEIISTSEDDTPFVPMTQEEAAAQLLAELGSDYHSRITDHFVFVYNTSANYAVWCGKLFESLYMAFERHQERREYGLPDPEFPMTVILFPNRRSFTLYAMRDMPNTAGIAAYYNRQSNRVILYDLSEEETERGDQQRKTRTAQDINRFLSRPQAAFSVMTIVHEATHQISFNRKLFLQTGPYPLWAVEGLAMFFETPDTGSSRGWAFRGTKGKPNLVRLNDLRNYLATRPVNPIRAVVREDHFNDDLLHSYAVSWGLFYYLQTKEPKKLALYLKKTAEKPPYVLYTPDERCAEFEEVFGRDCDQMLRDFERFLSSVR